MEPPTSTKIVAVDASVLINLIHVNRLDILATLGGFEFVMPQQAAEEVSNPKQARILARALEEGEIRKEPSTDPVELAVYAELRQVMGRGEAACLAMAQVRGWMVASDEKGRFLTEARERLGEGHFLNTPGILLLAIRQGVISVQEADRLKEVLERHRFKMTFDSFADLLDAP